APWRRPSVVACRGLRLGALIDHQGLRLAANHRAVDHHLGDIGTGRNVEHGVEQDILQNGAQAPGTGLAGQRLVGDGLQGVAAHIQLDPFHFEQGAVLLDQGILGLHQNVHQGLAIELLQGSDHRQATDKLRDETVAHQVLRLDADQELADIGLVLLALHLGAEADAALLGAILNHLFEPGEGAAADEQDVAGVDLQELLLGMLAPTLGWHGGDGALDQLEQGLLHPLTGDIAGDGGVIGLAGDLVDFIDIDDTALGLLHVVVALLQQLLDDVLDILAHVTRLGEGGGIGDGKGYVEQPGEGFRQQCLAAAGGADQQDIALAKLHFGATGGPLKALVVVVHGDGEHALGAALADDVLIEDIVDLLGGGQLALGTRGGTFLDFLGDDVVAQIDTFIADEYRGAGDQLAYFVLAFAAEGTVEQFAAIG